MSSQSFDAVIAGGGPAGLGTALNMARKGLHVLVLERDKIGATGKTWLSFGDTLKQYGLMDCVRRAFDEIVFSCYLGASYTLKRSDFIYPLHEEQALKSLADQATAAGAVIRGSEAFLNYQYDDKERLFTINSTASTYHSRVAIDAMGTGSPILKAHGLSNDKVDMGCLAFLLKGVSLDTGRLLLYDSFLPGTDFFWLVPLEHDRAMAGLFFFDTLDNSNLAEKSGKLKFYLQARGINGHIYETRSGNIPLGGQKVVNAGPFLCIGDNCNTPLPSSGFSFNRCLHDSELCATFTADYLAGNAGLPDYRRRLLGAKIPGIEVHLIISDMLTKFTNQVLNKAIAGMGSLSDDFLMTFLSGQRMDISFSVDAIRAILKTFTLGEIRSLSLRQNYYHNLRNLYDLLPGLTNARLTEQIMNFVSGGGKHDPAEPPGRIIYPGENSG